VSGDELVCPSCGVRHAASERFCEDCRMPLVLADSSARPPTPRERMARKVAPQYAQGPLVKVARARNLAEGEFLAGLLLEEGIPCTLQSSIAGHAPLAARDVLVAQSGAQAAREALEWEGPRGGGATGDSAQRRS